MHIKNFRQYTPENPDVPGAMYLKSEDGQDWYECQSLFSAETLKVVYNSARVITGISRVASVSVASGPECGGGGGYGRKPQS